MAVYESSQHGNETGGDEPPDRQYPTDLSNSPARPEEGFFDDELPFDIRIADWVGIKSQEISSKNDGAIGTQETNLIRLEDGSVYVYRKTVPYRRLHDTSVDFSLPLSTRVKGYNTYVARKLAEKGIVSRMIGTNQSNGFSLLHDAQAMLHILNVDDRDESYREETRYRTGSSIMTGYSMGAMKMLVALTLAPEMGRDVPLAIGLDPCLAEQVDYGKELEDLPGLVKYLGREALEIPRITLRNLARERRPLRTLKRLAHLAGTFGVTPKYFSIHYDKWNVIASGETAESIDYIPEYQHLILHFFNNCHFNDHDIYKERLSRLPYFREVFEPCYHLSGSDPSAVRRVVRKIEWGMALLDEGFTGHQLTDELKDPIHKSGRPRSAS